MNTPRRYNPVLVALHWFTVMLMLGAGFLSEDEGGSSPINIHMMLGGLLLVILVARLIVRFTTQRPAWATTGNALLNKLGRLVHVGLYGMAFFILGLGGLIAYKRNLFAVVLGTGFANDEGWTLTRIHHLGWILALLLIFAHVGTALYHQFILKDNLFERMWFGK
ncbi:MAG: cytochrome b/b6 domain-containing protein [Chloroflexi bacterium]|nr:cytochrome b/b6 domain-containing protein [Chloroflexota bacterium]